MIHWILEQGMQVCYQDSSMGCASNNYNYNQSKFIMLNKKQKLQMLKQAVMHMKNELEEIGDNNTQENYQKNITNSKSKNKDILVLQTQQQKSPKKQNCFQSIHSPRKPILTNEYLQTKQVKEVFKKYPSNVRNIMEAVENRYYQTRSTIDYYQSQRKSTSRTKTPQAQSLVTLASLTDRKYYQSVYSEVSQKENEQCQRDTNFGSKNNQLLQQKNRIKIFSLPYRDPILFPAQEKHSSKKIMNKKEKSPSNFLVSHPKCDQNLKFLGNVGIVSQSKGRMSSDRNRSLIFQRIGPVRQGRSCSKRHFGRYFQQQYKSCI